MYDSLLERARRYAAKVPGAVETEGGDEATFRLVVILIERFGLRPGEAMSVLLEWNGKCVPAWTEAQLMHKVQWVVGEHGCNGGGKGLAPSVHPGRLHGARTERPPKMVFCPQVLKRVAGKVDVDDITGFIRERSAVRVERQDSTCVLRLLYPEERVLIFSNMKSQGQMVWQAEAGFSERRLPAGPEGVWFLPQPVDGKFHPNPRMGGKVSRRSEESVTAWRYAVLESDVAEAEDWLRYLIQMPFRIVSICESGGRSIHALVRIDAESKSDWDEKVKPIKPVLVTLGADPGSLSAVRLTRLPQAMRGERAQRLLYLNPEPDGTPILQQKPRIVEVLS